MANTRELAQFASFVDFTGSSIGFSTQFNVSGVSTFTNAVIFDSTGYIQVPAGNTAQRDITGIAVTFGQVRYNTQLSQFEGFGAGDAWGSLGGVKDVDGDTFIRAESAAGEDEDVLEFLTGNSTRVVIDSAGLVGIGTNNPVYQLDVRGTSRFTDYIYGNITTNKIYVNDDLALSATKKLYFDTGSNTYIHEPTDDQLAVVTGGTERLRITSAGKIGIGITNPEDKLHLSASNHGIGDDFTLAKNLIRFEDTDVSQANNQVTGGILFEGHDTDSGAAGLQAAIICNAASSGGNGGSQLRFYTTTGGSTINGSSSERLRITDTGWQQGHAAYAGVGINTFASWARTGGAIRAEIGYNAVTTDYMYFGTGTNHPLALRVNNTNALYIKNDASRSIGIGTDTPGANLDVEGTLLVGTTGVANGTSTINGHLTVDRTGVAGSNPWLTVKSGDSSVFYVNGGGSVFANGGVNATTFTAGTSGTGNGNSSIFGSLTVDRNGIASSNTWFQVKNGTTPIIYANGQGKVGIGSDAPTTNLDVVGNIKSTGDVTASSFVTGASGAAIGINTNTISGPAELFIDPAAVGDNTGIVRIKGDLYVDGTTTQINSTALEIADFIVGIATTATTDTLADGAGIQIGPSGNTFLYDNTNTAFKSSENLNVASGKTYKIAGTDVLSADTLSVGTGATVHSPASNTLTLGTDSEERLRIDSSGRMMLGTTTEGHTSAQNLTVGNNTSGHSGITIRSSPSYIGSLFFSDATSSPAEYSGFVKYSHNGNFLVLGTDSTERLRITSDGSVGIGKTDPSGKLEVNGGYVTLRSGASSYPDGISAPIIYGTTGGGSNSFDQTGNLVLQTRSDAGSYNICMVTGDTPTERLRITSAGNIGIGTDNPISFGPTLQVSGTDPALLLQDNATAVDYFGMNIASGAVNTWFDDASALVIHTASAISGAGLSEKLRITSAGNVDLTGGGNLIINHDSKLYLEGDADDDLNAIWKANTENTLFLTSRYNIANVIDSNNDDTAAFWSVRHNGTTLAGSGELMRVQSNGKVGIGTDNPTEMMNITNASSTGSQMQFRDTSTGGADSDGFRVGYNGSGGQCWNFENTYFRIATSNTERLRITSSGTIGIGTNNPDNNLEVRTASNDEGILIKSTGSTSNALDFDANRSGAENVLGSIRGRWNGTTVAQISFIAGSDTTNKDDGAIIFGTESEASDGNVNATEKVRIDSAGRIGIGGNGVGSGLGVYLQRPSPNTAHFYEASDGTKKMITGVDSTNDYVKIGSLSNHRVGLVANNGEKISILPDGKIGIGITNPQRKFVVSDGGTEGLEFFVGDSVNGSTINAYNRTTASFTPFSLNAQDYRFSPSGGTEAVRITSAGKVGIGTDNPGSLVDIASGDLEFSNKSNSSAIQTINFSDGTQGRGKIRYLHDGDNLTFHTFSDERVRITSDGLVGIGTDAPSGKLNIVGSDTQLLNLVQDSGDLAIRLNDRGSGSAYIKVRDNTGGSLSFDTGGTERLRITSVGDLQRPKSLSQEVSTSVSSTSATSCGSFAKATYRSAYVIAQITQGSSYQVGRYLIIHDGTTATTIEESAIATGDMLGTFEGVISSSNVEFRVTMGSASSATVITKIESIVV